MGRSIRNPDKWIGISISTPLFNRLDYCKTMSHKLNSLLPPYLDWFIKIIKRYEKFPSTKNWMQSSAWSMLYTPSQ